MGAEAADTLLREIESSMTELRDVLRSINNFNPDDRKPKLLRCQRIIQSIRTSKDAVSLEIKGIQFQEEKTELRQSLKRQMEVFRSLVDNYEFKRTEIDRDQIQAEVDTFERMESNPQQYQALAARGDAVQDQTQDAISRMRGMALEAEDIGIETAAKIDRELEQMGRIAEELDDVEYNTQRAKDTALALARGAAGDLCIQILCGGIAICTITVIILVSV